MANNTIKIQLTEREFNKLSEEVGVSRYDLERLYSIGLLHNNVVLDFLIRHDFHWIKRKGKYKTAQVVTRLAMFYNVSKNRVYNAIHNKNVPSHYCQECGRLIRKWEFDKNEGLCSECVIKSIEIPD